MFLIPVHSCFAAYYLQREQLLTNRSYVRATPPSFSKSSEIASFFSPHSPQSYTAEPMPVHKRGFTRAVGRLDC